MHPGPTALGGSVGLASGPTGFVGGLATSGALQEPSGLPVHPSARKVCFLFGGSGDPVAPLLAARGVDAAGDLFTPRLGGPVGGHPLDRQR